MPAANADTTCAALSKIISTVESKLPQIEQTIGQIVSKFNVNEDALDGLLKDLGLEQSKV